MSVAPHPPWIFTNDDFMSVAPHPPWIFTNEERLLLKGLPASLENVPRWQRQVLGLKIFAHIDVIAAGLDRLPQLEREQVEQSFADQVELEKHRDALADAGLPVPNSFRGLVEVAYITETDPSGKRASEIIARALAWVYRERLRASLHAKNTATGWTEPMTKAEITKIFGVGKNAANAILERLENREINSRYQFKVSDMPPRYFQKRGQGPAV